MPSEDSFDFHRAEHMVAESAAIIEQAEQVALYHTRIKASGMSEYEAIELTKAWMAACFDTGSEDD